MSTTRIMMCPPDHFHVNYQINPWMKGNENCVSQGKAMEQWQHLVATIRAAGAEVVTMKPAKGWPDMVFTANAATVYRNMAVPARFLHEERRGEESYFKKWFRDNGFEVLELPKDLVYEGAGDSLFDRASGALWAGHGMRSDIRAHDYLAKWFDVEVLPLKLESEYYYHIDTCFCPLNDGFLLYYPDAFDAETNALIEDRVAVDKRIAVSEDEAAQFACNTVNVGNTVIMNAASDRLRGELEQRGFKVAEAPVAEFLKAGGSTKCLTLKVTEPDPGV